MSVTRLEDLIFNISEYKERMKALVETNSLSIGKIREAIQNAFPACDGMFDMRSCFYCAQALDVPYVMWCGSNCKIEEPDPGLDAISMHPECAIKLSNHLRSDAKEAMEASE